ncbi:hypothetical protein TruAng_005656 [Truncatella angustata]|nr:hypothetical protein TruAng_005656 [Truncatella angustata]
MKSQARLAVRLVQARPSLAVSSAAVLPRQIHTTPASPATVSSIHGQGPPPEPPLPAADSISQRIDRRKRQASMLQAAQEFRKSKTSSQYQPLRKRFWKDVSVKEVDGALEVHLDARPLRHPTTKQIVRLPLSKPLLANALALEWDLLTSVQQATKQHLIPLTSLVCRAVDIGADDAADGQIRENVVNMVMRYLDTDSLLCWAPPPNKYDDVPGQETLREKQEKAYNEIIGYLTTRVFPGVEIIPVLDGESLMPKSQSQITTQIIQGWVSGLNHWELAGLERAVLAGKSLLCAVRLVVEWSEGPAGTPSGVGAVQAGTKFGIEEAAKSSSLEVDWQIGNWGEVEDTHDVEKEDIRRQLGGVVLLISGTGRT